MKKKIKQVGIGNFSKKFKQNEGKRKRGKKK